MSNKINLVIQIQEDQCFPAVKNKAEFAYVGQLAINAPTPVEDTNEQEETLADIMNLIAQDNKQLLESYNQWRRTILSMVLAGELTYKQLIQLYIDFLPGQSSRISLSELEQSMKKPIIANVPVEKEQHTKELLANALASWISTKQVEPDRLFDQIENQPVAPLKL